MMEGKIFQDRKNIDEDIQRTYIIIRKYGRIDLMDLI